MLSRKKFRFYQDTASYLLNAIENSLLEEFVTVWKRGEYVYQMEVEDNTVFSIDEANNEIFLFNCDGVLKNSLWLWVIVTSMFILMLYSESA